MASSSSSLFLLSLVLTILSPTVLSETCKTQKFQTPNKTFTNCVDLPYLSAILHYTFNATTSTLSMAFTATPPKPFGWVAWAINPISGGMSGANTLLAYTTTSSVVVNAFHLESYSNISSVSPLSINVSAVSGESSAGKNITIFATWRLPVNTSSVNQVWQVGPSVSKGVPFEHDMDKANLQAKSKLVLTRDGKADEPESPAASPAPESPASKKNDAGELLGRFGVCMVLGFAASIAALF